MNDLSAALLPILWRSSWQGAIVVALVWCVCRAFERRLPASLRCILYRLTYLKLLLGVALVGSGVGGVALPLLRPVPVKPVSMPMPIAAPTAVAVVNAPPIPAAFAVTALPAIPVLTQANRADAPIAQTSGFRLTYQIVIAIAYLVGLLVCLTRLLSAGLRTRRVLRAATPIDDPETRSLCAALSVQVGLRHPPTVAQSAALTSPAYVAGTILLPTSADYAPDALRLILAHELAHARRHDLAYEWLGVAAQTLFFFHPLVYLARREERLARESAADALALRITNAPPATFGKLLLTLALEPHAPALAGAVGAVERGTLLRRRLVALKEIPAMPAPRTLLLLPLVALLALVPLRLTRAVADAARNRKIVAPDTLTVSRKMPLGDGEITGQVKDEAGNPVPNAYVTAESTFAKLTFFADKRIKTGQILEYKYVVRTDTQGNYALHHLPLEEVTGRSELGCTYWLTLNDRAPYSPATKSAWVSPNPVTHPFVRTRKNAPLHEDEKTKTVDFIAHRGVTISGRLLNYATGAPVADALVVGNAGLHPVENNTTDRYGRYFLRLPSGQDRVFVTHVRWADKDLEFDHNFIKGKVQHYKGNEPYVGKDIQLSDGQNATVDLSVLLLSLPKTVAPTVPPGSEHTPHALPSDKTISGQVRDEQGRPVAHIQVSMVPRFANRQQRAKLSNEALMKTEYEEGRYYRITSSDVQGRYALKGLKEGEYSLSLGLLGSPRVGKSSSAKPSEPLHPYISAVIVTVQHNDTVKIANITASPGIIVSGRVLDQTTGRPVANTHIMGTALTMDSAEDKESMRELGDCFATSKTNADGRYFLRLPTGRVCVSLMNCALEQQATVTLPPRGYAEHDFAVMLSPALTFVGPDGKPAAGVFVTIHNAQNRSPGGIPGTTDDQGRYYLGTQTTGTFAAGVNGITEFGPRQSHMLYRTGKTGHMSWGSLK